MQSDHVSHMLSLISAVLLVLLLLSRGQSRVYSQIYTFCQYLSAEHLLLGQEQGTQQIQKVLLRVSLRSSRVRVSVSPVEHPLFST